MQIFKNLLQDLSSFQSYIIISLISSRATSQNEPGLVLPKIQAHILSASRWDGVESKVAQAGKPGVVLLL